MPFLNSDASPPLSPSIDKPAQAALGELAADDTVLKSRAERDDGFCKCGGCGGVARLVWPSRLAGRSKRGGRWVGDSDSGSSTEASGMSWIFEEAC